MSTYGNTPNDLFDDPTFRDSSFGAAPRDFFTIGRMSVHATVVLDDGTSVKGQFFVGADLASQKILGAHPLTRSTSQLAAQDLIPLLEKVMATYGKPRKGWLFSYSVWWSMYDLLQDEDARLRARGRDFQQDGVSFGRTPVAERIALEDWLSSRGCECTFNEEWLYGRPKMTARLSEATLHSERN